MIDSEAGLFATRRQVVAGMAATLPLVSAGLSPLAAAELAGNELPLHTNGLEHLGLVTADVTKSATFYCNMFGHGLFREVDPPLRYYVMTGKSYIAIGSREGVAPKLDHYCTTVIGYNREKMDARISGMGYRALGRGVALDRDGLGLQLIEDPAGLVDTNVPADRILGRGYGLVQPICMDHVLLKVSDLKASLPFYDAFFPRVKARADGQVWFGAADTTIRIEQQAAGKAPEFARYAIRTGPFDAGRVAEGVAKVGGTVLLKGSKGQLRIADPDKLQFEIVPV